MCGLYESCLEWTGATLHSSTIEQLVQLDVPSTGSVDFLPPPARVRGLQCGPHSRLYSAHTRPIDVNTKESRRCSGVVLTCTRTFRPQPGRSPAAAPRSKPAPEPSTPCAASDSCLGSRAASRFRTCRCSWASCDRSTCGVGILNSEKVMYNKRETMQVNWGIHMRHMCTFAGRRRRAS